MAKINFSSGFTPKMPAPVTDLSISFRGAGMLYLQYAGFAAFLIGDFVDRGTQADPIGNVYKISVSGPSGSFIAEDFTLTAADILGALRSLDLSDLIQRISSGNDSVGGYGEQYGGAGNDTFENVTKGPAFGGPGTDIFVSSWRSADIALTLTDFGTEIKPTFGGAVTTLVGIEKVKFTDKTVDISPAAPIYDYAAAARAAILREAPNDFLTYADGKAGTKSAIASALMAKAEDSTLPAVIAYHEIMGKTPNSSHLDSLAAFVNGQIKSPGYQATANPRLGGYEAMGLGLSGTPEFAAKFGGGSETDLIRTEYQHLFGRAATQAQVDHFVGQIDYFDGLYIGAGISHADAAVKARGAAIGQMLGFAAVEKADIHDAAVAFLMKAADGTAVYGSALDMM